MKRTLSDYSLSRLSKPKQRGFSMEFEDSEQENRYMERLLGRRCIMSRVFLICLFLFFIIHTLFELLSMDTYALFNRQVETWSIPARKTYLLFRIFKLVLLSFSSIVCNLPFVIRRKRVAEILFGITKFSIIIFYVFLATLKINSKGYDGYGGINEVVVTCLWIISAGMQIRAFWMPLLLLAPLEFFICSIPYNLDNLIDLSFFSVLYFAVTFLLVHRKFMKEKDDREQFVALEAMKEVNLNLRRESRRTRLILSNIFPTVIVDDVIEGFGTSEEEEDGNTEIMTRVQKTTVDAGPSIFEFPKAALLFSDFVQFTTFCESTNAEELVLLLNEYYSRFDQIMQAHSMEKVKTIGDAYFSFTQIENCAITAVYASLEMVEFVSTLSREKFKKSFEIRIGLACGAVYGCVMGKKLLSFEMYGPSVAKVIDLQEACGVGEINCDLTIYEECKESSALEFTLNDCGGWYVTESGAADEDHQQKKQQLLLQQQASPVSEYNTKIIGSDSSSSSTASSTTSIWESSSDNFSVTGEDDYEEEGEQEPSHSTTIAVSICQFLERVRRANCVEGFLLRPKKENRVQFAAFSYAINRRKVRMIPHLSTLIHAFVLYCVIFPEQNKPRYHPIVCVLCVLFALSLFVGVAFCVAVARARASNERMHLIARIYIVILLVIIVSMQCLLVLLFYLDRFNGKAWDSLYFYLFLIFQTPLLNWTVLILFASVQFVLYVIVISTLFREPTFVSFFCLEYPTIVFFGTFLAVRDRVFTLRHFRTKRSFRRGNKKLFMERKKNETLILSCLPRDIGETFLNRCVSRHFERFNRCIMSAVIDTGKFLNSTSPTTIGYVIDFLNNMFILFDSIVIKRQTCVKIKSFLSSYLLIGREGAGERSCMLRTARSFALAFERVLNAYASKTGIHCSIRIGLHKGVFIGGVVGLTRIAMDVFGNSINTCFRITTDCEANRIHCSESFVAEFPEHKRGMFIERGERFLKGKSQPLKTYYYYICYKK